MGGLIRMAKLLFKNVKFGIVVNWPNIYIYIFVLLFYIYADLSSKLKKGVLASLMSDFGEKKYHRSVKFYSIFLWN